jgi:DNA helicase-2/ATP-dependent DNA helicase PcrA
VRDPSLFGSETTTEVAAGLNAAQREAVLHPGGPLLVLAGAGSGKTRVIVHRIAHLLRDRGVPPDRLIAVTFTNKAAEEVRERVAALLHGAAGRAFVGTFHALCLRLLRREGGRIGLERDFLVYDTDDQLRLIKLILREEGDPEGAGSPRAILSRISRAKNALERPEALERRAAGPEQRRLVALYREYQAALARNRALDFDDLLLRTLDLFESDAEFAQRQSERCEHLLVDEYQDTNRPQYLLVRHLSSVHHNVCVVGDEDQSIYRFRGAEIRNILDFERDHPGARTIRLECNYRSTGTILAAAGAVIAHNTLRKGKRLWTDNPRGEPIELHHAADDRTEAAWVARRIQELEERHGLETMAVLYRTNAQSRQFEEQFRSVGIAHQVVGSVRFYERKEVKDLLAYLRLAVNRADDLAFRRVINTPPRGLGATTLARIDDMARTLGVSGLEAAERALEQGLLGAAAAASLERFLELIAELARRAAADEVAGLVEHVVREVGYEAYLVRTYAGQAEERMENVRALVSATVEYLEEQEHPTLAEFLDSLALVADSDEVGARPGVTMMTIHTAKGLEYSVVFLAGLEEGLFPHSMSTGRDEDLEEERRLCYVAMTRAKERLLLSRACYRRLQGLAVATQPSRFLDEVPAELVRMSAAARDHDYDVRESWRDRGSSAARAAVRMREPERERAAAPLRPIPAVQAQADPGDGYTVGAFVLHPRFGAGRIVRREGRGANLRLSIHFSDHGTKLIAPAYTKLKVEL